jgi:rhodanese-related sulfurtransferase
MWIAAVVLALGAGAGAGAASAAERVEGVKPGVVDGAQARKLVAKGVKVIDVRTPAEFAGGHVPGAVNIPHDQVAARAGEIGPSTTPVLLYCRTGRRTQIAAEALRAKGFQEIYDLQAYEKWVESEGKR